MLLPINSFQALYSPEMFCIPSYQGHSQRHRGGGGGNNGVFCLDAISLFAETGIEFCPLNCLIPAEWNDLDRAQKCLYLTEFSCCVIREVGSKQQFPDGDCGNSHGLKGDTAKNLESPWFTA